MPSGRSGDEPPVTRRRGDRHHRGAGAGPKPHHIIAGLVAVAVLLVLAVSGLVPGLGSTGLARGLVSGGRTPGSSSASASASASTRPTATPATSTTAPHGPLTMVGLGDSVPSADTCFCTGYVEQVGQRLHDQTGRPWVVHNDAHSGWTTADVEHDLSSSSGVRNDLADAALVVVEVGANDFDLGRVEDQDCFPAFGSDCWADTNQGVHDGLVQIVKDIHSIDRRPDVQIAVLGYWNVTLDGSVGRAQGKNFVLGSDSLTRLVNQTVQQTAAQTGAVYVDAYTALKGQTGTQDPTSLLLDDGDHPNAAGHRLLADAVLQSLNSAGLVAAWRSTP